MSRYPASSGEPQKACYWGDTDRRVLKALKHRLEAEGTEDREGTRVTEDKRVGA